MSSFDITTMTSRGQVVIPQTVRKSLALDSGTKFIVLSQQDTVIFKKLSPPSKGEIGLLLAKTRRLVKEKKLKKSALKAAIEHVRKAQ